MDYDHVGFRVKRSASGTPFSEVIKKTQGQFPRFCVNKISNEELEILIPVLSGKPEDLIKQIESLFGTSYKEVNGALLREDRDGLTFCMIGSKDEKTVDFDLKINEKRIEGLAVAGYVKTHQKP